MGRNLEAVSGLTVPFRAGGAKSLSIATSKGGLSTLIFPKKKKAGVLHIRRNTND